VCVCVCVLYIKDDDKTIKLITFNFAVPIRFLLFLKTKQQSKYVYCF